MISGVREGENAIDYLFFGGVRDEYEKARYI